MNSKLGLNNKKEGMKDKLSIIKKVKSVKKHNDLAELIKIYGL